jgi:hypothetical protein
MIGMREYLIVQNQKKERIGHILKWSPSQGQFFL